MIYCSKMIYFNLKFKDVGVKRYKREIVIDCKLDKILGI